MSILTREILASAASSPHGLTAGTVADPVRLTWREVHDQAKRMAGSLAAKGVGRHGSVAVLATDAADVAPLAQAIWLRGAALTMLQQPTPRTDLAVWLGRHRAGDPDDPCRRGRRRGTLPDGAGSSGWPTIWPSARSSRCAVPSRSSPTTPTRRISRCAS